MNIRKKVNQFIFLVKKNSPVIKLVIGLTSNFAGTALAVKVSLDPDTREIIDMFKNSKDDEAFTKRLQDLIMGLVKKYGLAVVLYVLGDALIINSHAEMSKRNSALAATNTMLAAAVASANKIESKKTVTDADGNTKEVSMTKEDIKNMTDEEYSVLSYDQKRAFQRDAAKASEKGLSPFSFFFDEGNPNFQHDNPSANLSFCLAKQQECRDFFSKHGEITMRDIKIIFGVPEYDIRPVDYQAGWIDLGPIQPTVWVDLGIDEDPYAATNRSLRMNYEGFEPVVLINPIDIFPNILACGKYSTGVKDTKKALKK